MNRRDFLALTAAAPAMAAVQSISRTEDMLPPIIDTHIHLFDTERAGGVPWPAKNDETLYRPALSDRYRRIAEPLGIVGAVVVEASPWLEDNQWVLDEAAKDSIIVGTIGNLEPGQPDFRQQLERFHRNLLFRGIRYGNLWGRDLTGRLKEPAFISDLQFLAEAGLVLDTANPNPALLEAIVRVTDHVPNLRVVIDHLPQIAIPGDDRARRRFDADLQELGSRNQVFVKISAVLRRVDGVVPTDLSFYRERLDMLFETFGQDRLLYGSDWPNSDKWQPLNVGLNLVGQYFTGKGKTTAEKYFWKNSLTAYQWRKRHPSQPG